MSDTPRFPTPLEEKVSALDEAMLAKGLGVFLRSIDFRSAALLNSCVHCGLCADSCHYSLTIGDEKSLPAYKVGLIEKVFKRYATYMGRNFPTWLGAHDFDEKMVREWIDSLYGRCSMCGRCTISCTIGLNVPSLVRAARGALAAMDLVPPGLQSTVDKAVTTGNNMGIPTQDWLETVDWLQEELQTAVGDPSARLPIDKEGARFLYTANPREPAFFPLSLIAAGKIFHAAGENWTLPSEHYDLTNYGLFSGDIGAARTIAERLVKTMERLGTKTLVIGECGHGFAANRWEGPEWLQEEYGFEVKSILEIVAGYIRDRRIKLDPSRNTKRVTLHDPCNLVRHGGIVEEQRYILRHAVSDFVEMTPNREKNFCCGGGGGQLAMSCFTDRRKSAGGVKAEQIKQTEAKIVVAPCHNCIDQLTELNKHFKLGVEVRTVCEVTANALVLPAE